MMQYLKNLVKKKKRKFINFEAYVSLLRAQLLNFFL